MPVSLARYAGFCMGVRRAVDGALNALSKYSSVVSYGELAHNPEVLSFLASRGLSVIHSPEEACGKTVLIRSHGIAPSLLHELQSKASQVIDLTCPFVQRLHDCVSAYSIGGLPVILVGECSHPEVIGTVGCAHGAVYIVSSIEDAVRIPPLKEALAVSQTTFPEEKWQQILTVLEKGVENLICRKTICTATAHRQKCARELAARSTHMIVVGGKNSANTQKLFETCSALCAKTLLIEHAADLSPGFADILRDDIGITAGASTPDWSIKEVVTRMTEMEQMNQVNTEEAKNSFMADVEASMVRIKPGQTVKGTVVQLTEDEIGVDIGYKSDGLLKREDLVDENVKIGDEIEVEVVKVNDGEGNVLLNQRNILLRKAFAGLTEKYKNNEYVEGTVKEAVKGGLLCNVDGVRAFVPASLVSNRFVDKIDSYVGQTLSLKIIEIDEQKHRIVASHRHVVREQAAAKKAEVWEKLEENKIVHGIVRRLTNFGAFVDLGGVDGLIHVTDLSWSRVNNPADVVSPDQEVDVLVLSLDKEKDRIQLGLKQLQPKPWDLAPEKYAAGNIVTGKVVRITTFGAFVELEPGIDGLIHISQCADKRINKVEDAVNVGDEVTVKVLSIDPEKKRISLSIRALLEPEQAPVEEQPAEEVAVQNDDEDATPVDVAAVVAQLENEAENN